MLRTPSSDILCIASWTAVEKLLAPLFLAIVTSIFGFPNFADKLQKFCYRSLVNE